MWRILPTNAVHFVLMTTPLSETELDQLSEFLDGLASPDAMNIERLDGFFCALVIGPDPVMPSEYWPRIVGEEHAESSATFDSMEQAQTIMSLVMRHWNTIAETLEADEIYIPILLEDDDGLARGSAWAQGFMEGVNLRRDGWQPFINDDDRAGAIVPMMALAHEGHPDPELRFESPTAEKRLEMLQMMTAGILQMYRYFTPMRSERAVPARPFVRNRPKVGRNEHCPCGSGKKYKQCCLAQTD